MTRAKTRFSSSGTMRLAALLAIPTLAVSSASGNSGSTSTWTGGGADSNWSTPLNWNPVAAPSNDGTANLLMDGSNGLSPVVNTPWSINSLSFDSTAGSFSISGSAVTLGAGGLANLSSTTQTLGMPIVLEANQTWDTGTSGYMFVNNAIKTNGYALSLTDSAGALLRQQISGTGSLGISGSETVVIYGTNNYSGGTSINQAELYFTADTALGAALNPITISNGGDLDYGGSANATINRQITLGAGGAQITDSLAQYGTLALAGSIQGPGSLTVNGGGASYLQLSGTNNYSGGTIVTGGTLLGTTTSIQGNISLGGIGAMVEFQQDTNGTYSGNISGGGELAKYGAGIVTLSGNNTYSSDTMLYTGALEVYPGGLSPNSRLIFEGGGGVVQFVGTETYTAALGSTVIWNGAGGFSARGGKLTVNLGGSGAQINFSPSYGAGSGSLVFGTSTADSETEFQNPLYTGSAISSPGPSIQVNPGVGGDYALVSGQITGANTLTKTGAGTLQLSAANTFSGGLIIAAGTVQANDGVGLPATSPLTLAGGVLMGNGSFTRSLGTAGGTVRWNASGGFAASDGTLTVNIGGAAAMQTWGATNFVPTVSTLLFGAARADAETIFLNPIALGTTVRTIEVDPGLGGDYTSLKGALSGTAGIVKTGLGQLTLAGTSSFTGASQVSSGKLVVTGSLAKTAFTIYPGASLGGTGSSAGSVTVDGSNNPALAGTLNFVDGAPGTFTLSDPTITDTVLTLGGSTGIASTMDFEVGNTADRVLISAGKLLVNTGGAGINITPLAGLHSGIYDLIDFPANQATGLGNLTLDTTSVPGYTLSLLSTSTAEQLDVQAVPEPSTLFVAATSAGYLLSRRRRVRRG